MNIVRGVLGIPSYVVSAVLPNSAAEPLLQEKDDADLVEAEAQSLRATNGVGAGTSQPLQGSSNGTRHSDAALAVPNGHTNGHVNGFHVEEEEHVKLETAPRQKKIERTAYGLALYAISSCFLATMLMFAKKLGQWNIPTFEILLARSGFLVFFALVGNALQRQNPLGKRRGLLLVRGIFGFGAIGNYLFAVSLLPLNDTLVLTFTAPIWAAVLGPCLIKEKPSKAVGIAILLCFSGVALITQPSFLGFTDTGRITALGAFFALFQACLTSPCHTEAFKALCSACAKMCVRELRAEHPNVSVFYMAWVSLVAALIGCFLPMTWGATDSFRIPDHWAEWVLLVGVGVTSYGSQFCMTNALRHARAAPALAMSYISIVLTITYGYFLFNEVPTVLSVTGAVLICVSTLSLGAFEKTHPVVSMTPDPSMRGGHAAADGLGAYAVLPEAEAPDRARS
ncbi:probable pseudopaline exporter CntI [Coccomyxa sp. Obi]|nr:probable pseudopaline exporter CntI [Coccomyxa sp. Obi]